MTDTFSRATCDTVTDTIKRTQPDADHLLAILGLVETTGHTRDDGHKSTKPVARRPIWEEPIIGDLRPVGGKSVHTDAGAGWLS